MGKFTPEIYKYHTGTTCHHTRHDDDDDDDEEDDDEDDDNDDDYHDDVNDDDDDGDLDIAPSRSHKARIAVHTDTD